MNKFEPFTEETAKEYLIKVVKEKIRHQDYDHVVDLAEKYYSLVTGDGLDEMLEQIVTRETKEMFDQRKKITKHIIPSIINPTKLPYKKATRKQPLVRRIDFDKESKNSIDESINELNGYISKYWGDKSLEEFFEWAFVDYGYIDPNSFILTDFENFDPKKTKATPYPTIITSDQAIDYVIINEQLQYLLILLPNKFVENDVEVVGEQYNLVLGDVQYQLNQVSKDSGTLEEVIEINSKYFEFKKFNPKSPTIPAHRIGFIKDYQTDGRTCVSIIHCAIGILEKTLKINSELDLSTAMVAFPRRFSYVQKCTSCNKGHLPDGTECKECNGTGNRKHHGSTADIVELPMPESKDDMISLAELIYDHQPPIDLLKFQDEYCDKLKRVVYNTMFNSEIFTRSDTVQTATEKTIEVDNMNDTLFPFLRKYSQLWKGIVTDIATFTELGKGLILEHKFPFDLKFKSLNDLMVDLKTAKDSGASSATIAAIEDDINEILYNDRPEELKKIRVKNQFNPFRGFSSERLAMAINTNKTTKYNEVLYLNLESIFQNLEQKNKSPWIYDLDYDKINELIKEEVELILKDIEKEKPEIVPFSQKVKENNEV